MAKFSVTVTNSKGFHLRPASKLLQLASDFQQAHLLLHHPESGRSADCRNMMALMMMSSPQGTEFELEICNETDPEELTRIEQAVRELFSTGFNDEP